MSVAQENIHKISFVATVRRLWPVLRNYKLKFGAAVLLIAITTAIEIALPIVLGKTVDAVISGTRSVETVTRLALWFLAGIIGKSLFESMQAYLIQSTGQSVVSDLRNLLFQKITRLPVAYFDRNPTGRLLTRVVNDIKSLSELFTAAISVLALDVLVIAGTVIAMFSMHWKLAGIVLFTFPLVFVTVFYFGEQLGKAYREVRLRLSEINSFLGENIGAVATIQRLGAESARYQRFEGITQKHQDAQMKTLRVFALVQPLANVLNGVSVSSLMLVGGLWVIQGELTVGVVVAFLGYLKNLFQPIRDLVEKYNTFLSAMVSAERVVNILKEEDETDAGVDEKLGYLSNPSIEFSSVSFRYPTREQDAISGVSFTVPSGESLAIVGATGSGKSTLVRLLLRFYEPSQGEIRLGGIAISAIPKAALRAYLGVVHQEMYLFPGTIRENLTLRSTKYTDNYLVDNLKRAQLWDLLEPRGGLDAEVLEGGANLSNGERQLLSFARVLVMNSPVILLDEATSSVDPALERRLMTAIAEGIRGRTTLIIAHRLSTIRHCDKILVMNHGKVEQYGGRDELLSQTGIFQELAALSAET